MHLGSSYTGFFQRSDGLPAGGAVGDVLTLDAGLNLSWAAGGGGGASGDLTYLDAVTGYTGGGASNLDGTTTVGVTVPALYSFVHPVDGLRFFELRAGTDAEASPGIVRPDDYAGGTNEKVFQSVL